MSHKIQLHTIGMEFYDINVKDAKGNIVQMSEYAGKVLLIVNTATECGFTPQYKALQGLYEQFNGINYNLTIR